jgi:hypothetical protein
VIASRVATGQLPDSLAESLGDGGDRAPTGYLSALYPRGSPLWVSLGLSEEGKACNRIGESLNGLEGIGISFPARMVGGWGE